MKEYIFQIEALQHRIQDFYSVTVRGGGFGLRLLNTRSHQEQKGEIATEYFLELLLNFVNVPLHKYLTSGL